MRSEQDFRRLHARINAAEVSELAGPQGRVCAKEVFGIFVPPVPGAKALGGAGGDGDSTEDGT